MSRIALVDDDETLLKTLRAFLEKEGHEALELTSGEALLETLEAFRPDAVILDVMMPGMDGFQTLSLLRARSSVPVFFLTAMDGDAEQCAGLDLGADDYITKPFKPQILVAKIRALLRRSALDREAPPQDVVRSYGNVTVDMASRRAAVNGSLLSLTPTELRLLYYFINRPEQLLTRPELLRELWGFEEPIASRAADEACRRLRRKLLQAGASVFNETVWGEGYRFTERRGAPS